ncbi:unnamed protein product [Pylaiella littoralis]
MTERDQQALQKGFQGLGDNIDRLYSRPLQKTAYLCMAKCNDNSKLSSEAVSACMKRCEGPLQEINQVVQQEVGGLQNRMQRCAMDCADEAKDTIPAGAKEGDAVVERAMAQNIKCTSGCAKKHLALLPTIEGKIKAAAERAADRDRRRGVKATSGLWASPHTPRG